MDAPTPRDALLAALADLDRAVEGCLRLAWATGLDPDDRLRAAQRAVDAYEQADRRADLLLSAIIAGGGCPGLLEAVEAAVSAAGERTGAVLALTNDDNRAAAARALVVAEHAEEHAAARDVRVRREVVEPWARRQAGRRADAAA